MTEREVAIRIVVRRPPPGVAFAMQRGTSELIPPAAREADAMMFDATVRVGGALDDGAPRFLGAVTQGPPSARFVYINSGKRVGQPSSPWDRRAKVSLTGISMAMVEEVFSRSGARLETEFEGTAKDGGPTCASVKGIVWRVV